MGASVVGNQTAPPSAFGVPEPLDPELLLAPELVPGPPELDPLDPLEPAEPLDAPDPPAFPELAVPEPDPAPELPTPEDASDPESRAFVSSGKTKELPLLPEHPIDEAREARSTARTRASDAIMVGRATQRTYRASRTAICGVYRCPRGECPSSGDNQKMTLTTGAMRRAP
jgi:hypothetical protein